LVVIGNEINTYSGTGANVQRGVVLSLATMQALAANAGALYAVARVDTTVYDTAHVPVTEYDTARHDTTLYNYTDTLIYIEEYRDTLIYQVTRRDTTITDTAYITDTTLTTVEIVDTALVPETLVVYDTLVEGPEVEVPFYVVIDPVTATQTVVSEDARAVDGANGILLEGLTPGAPYLLYHNGRWTKFVHQ